VVAEFVLVGVGADSHALNWGEPGVGVEQQDYERGGSWGDGS
jgi:hypothetical protein